MPTWDTSLIDGSTVALLFGGDADVEIDWGDGTIETDISGEATCTTTASPPSTGRGQGAGGRVTGHGPRRFTSPTGGAQAPVTSPAARNPCQGDGLRARVTQV